MTSPSGGAPVLLDVQGTQSVDHRDRGIARYVLELAKALEEAHGGLIRHFLLNPDLAPPARFEPLAATGKVTFSDRSDPPEGGILHVLSPYELQVPLGRLWPPWATARRLRLVVTVYDLIPEVLSDHYLADPGLRRRYRSRHHLVRSAERVLAISRATADEAVGRLGVEGDRVRVVGAAPSPQFRRPASREAALASARAAVPGLGDGFVLYTGGTEHRKNVERLLVAFSALPPTVRGAHQLVIACQVKPLERNHLEHRGRALGIGDRLLLPGYVPDDTLRLLYQATDLFVFPSLQEGYGLPVAEALACGAPVVAADIPALAELVHEEARFDPADVGAVARAVERGLTDQGLRERLLDRARRPPTTWRDVAERTAAVYEELLARRPPPPPRRRPLVAFVSPLPPQRTGVAQFSFRLLEELRPLCEVDAFADSATEPVRAPEGIAVHPVDRLGRVEACRGGYDRVLYSLGNSEFHGGALAALRRRPGLVLAHEVRLAGLYALAAHRGDAVPGGFHAAVQRMYGGRVPGDLGRDGRIEPEEADRFGVLMVKEVLGLAERFLVMSRVAADLARLDAGAGSCPIEVVPPAVRAPSAPGPVPLPEPAGPVVATFGIVNEVKQIAKVLQAFAEVVRAVPDARLAVVGPASLEDEARFSTLAHELGIADQALLTNEVDEATYAGWLCRATLALQLRAVSNGESSAAIGDCLAFGVPTVVAAVGPARELPDGCVVKGDAAIPPEALASEVLALLADGERRTALSRAAAAHARASTFARLAAELYRFLAPAASFSST